MEQRNRRVDMTLGLGLAGFVLLPWYRIEEGFYAFRWLARFPFGADEAPGLVQMVSEGRWWLAVVAALLLAAAAVRFFSPAGEARGRLLTALGMAGMGFLVLQGFAITFTGWSWTIGEALFGLPTNHVRSGRKQH